MYIHVICSLVAMYVFLSFTINCLYIVLLSMVNRLHDDLYINYEISRQRPHEEEWPPDQPSSIVNLALIHY